MDCCSARRWICPHPCPVRSRKITLCIWCFAGHAAMADVVQVIALLVSLADLLKAACSYSLQNAFLMSLSSAPEWVTSAWFTELIATNDSMLDVHIKMLVLAQQTLYVHAATWTPSSTLSMAWLAHSWAMWTISIWSTTLVERQSASVTSFWHGLATTTPL